MVNKQFAIRAKTSVFDKEKLYASLLGSDFQVIYATLSEAQVFASKKSAKKFMSSICNPTRIMKVERIKEVCPKYGSTS